MLSCTEQGLWPDNVSDGLGELELDALIEHAAGCLYHQRLLDQDEEEFLAELRHASDLLCFDPFAQIRSAASHDCPQEIRFPAPEETRRSPVSARQAADALYDRYRQWSDARCPIEIIQVRSGGRNVCTLDLVRDGSTWRLCMKAGDAPLQFWTICRQHQDEVMLAAYPIPLRASGRAEASTLSFANGQSLSALASPRGGSEFDVLLHCTSPQAPSGARYVVYNFDSLAGHGGLEAAGIRYCKTSWLLNDFAKLSELRFPTPDLEAARLFREHPREKNVAELLDVAAEQYWQDAEPLRLYHPTEVDDTSFDAQDEGSEQSATIVALLKDWVGCHSSKHLYRPYRRMTGVKRLGFRVEPPCTAGESWREWVESCVPHIPCDRLHLIVGARVVSFSGSYLDFVSTKRGAYHEQHVGCSNTSEPPPFLSVCRRIGEYYGHCARPESWPRLSVPFGTGGREQSLSQLTWSALPGDSAHAGQWHLSQEDLLGLFERVFVRFVSGWGAHPYEGEVRLQSLWGRLHTTVDWEREFEDCALQVLDCIGQAELFEIAFRTMRYAGGDARLWSLGSDIDTVIPATASLLVAGTCGSESCGELP